MNTVNPTISNSLKFSDFALYDVLLSIELREWRAKYYKVETSHRRMNKPWVDGRKKPQMDGTEKPWMDGADKPRMDNTDKPQMCFRRLALPTACKTIQRLHWWRQQHKNMYLPILGQGSKLQ